MFTMVGSIAPMLKKYGLKPTSRHFPFAYVTGNWDFIQKNKLPVPEDKSFESVVEDASKHNVKHLVMPNLFPNERGDIDQYKIIAHRLNQIGEICQQAGIQLNYHNHNFEFHPKEGLLPFDVIMNETDPKLVSFQLDVYYLYIMGMNPAGFIGELGNRTKLLHLKDLNKRNNSSDLISLNKNKPSRELWDETVALGTGLLDFESILATAKKNNVENFYIEVEGVQSNSLEVIKQSIEHIKSLGI
jgi:sugar phosphate isomerase/epimerase